jgi:perosamine synthetase
MPDSLIQVSVPMTGEEEAAAAREVILSGRFVSGPKVAAFEEGFAAYVGAAHGCATNSGTAALHLALAALDIGPGDEVIVPPLTFMSTVTAVLHQNAAPVFADIRPDTLCLDPADVEQRITPRTRAIIPVHLFGNAADMDALTALAEARGLHVIEDCAQAHGTRWQGRRVGSIGHMGAFSFYATKHMTTGEGGMVTTSDPALAERVRRLRSHGMANRDEHAELGWNYRMNEMAAAIGLVQLGKLGAMNRARIEHSRYLLDALAASGAEWLELLPEDPRVEHTYFWCPLAVRPGYDAVDAAARLRERGVEVRRRYNTPLYAQPVLARRSPYPGGCPFACRPEAGQDYAALHLPVAEARAGRLIGLPNHPGLSRQDLDAVVHAVRTLYP